MPTGHQSLVKPGTPAACAFRSAHLGLVSFTLKSPFPRLLGDIQSWSFSSGSLLLSMPYFKSCHLCLGLLSALRSSFHDSQSKLVAPLLCPFKAGHLLLTQSCCTKAGFQCCFQILLSYKSTRRLHPDTINGCNKRVRGSRRESLGTARPFVTVETE